MEDLELTLKELKKYIGQTDNESCMKFKTIVSELEAMELAEQERSILNKFIAHGFSEIKEDMANIEKELDMLEPSL
ncbi:MAG: hypothetical protein H6Q13_1655 [Bacteroidetes bacterium]|nr:hypothetical protein [Bacteroidota bacterium]